MHASRAPIALVFLLVLTGAACSTTKKAVAIPVYTITATEPSAGHYSFSVPSNMKGGVVTLRIQNNGKEPHDFQLIEKTAGHTLADLLKGLGNENAPLSNWLQAAGGVGAAGPGRTIQATLRVAPGTYWFICTESSDSGVSHATHGMAGELTFTGTSGAALPASRATIQGKEYTFTTSGLKAGSNTVTFSNTGQQLHHALIVPIAPGKTLDDVRKAILSNSAPSGPPPVDFQKAQAFAVLNPGQSETETIQLDPGTNYAFFCFVPDRGTSGPPHAAKGMLTAQKIS